MRLHTEKVAHGYGITSDEVTGGLVLSDDGQVRSSWGELGERLAVVEAQREPLGLRVLLTDDGARKWPTGPHGWVRDPSTGRMVHYVGQEPTFEPVRPTSLRAEAGKPAAPPPYEGPQTLRELLADRPKPLLSGTSGAGEEVDDDELEWARDFLAGGDR